MARYTGPVCRICRRYGEKLMLKGDKCVSRSARSSAPHAAGRHRSAAARSRTAACSCARSRRRATLRRAGEAVPPLLRGGRAAPGRHRREPGAPAGDAAGQRRLPDGLRAIAGQARQLVRHGHITLNGRKTDIPLRHEGRRPDRGPGEPPRARSTSRSPCEQIKAAQIPEWLNVDAAKMTGRSCRRRPREQMPDGVRRPSSSSTTRGRACRSHEPFMTNLRPRLTTAHRGDRRRRATSPPSRQPAGRRLRHDAGQRAAARAAELPAGRRRDVRADRGGRARVLDDPAHEGRHDRVPAQREGAAAALVRRAPGEALPGKHGEGPVTAGDIAERRTTRS